MGSKLLWGFTLGLITGLLLAPDKGSETRERISRKADDLKDKFNDFVDGITEKFESFKTEAREKVRTAKHESQAFAEGQGGVL